MNQRKEYAMPANKNIRISPNLLMILPEKRSAGTVLKVATIQAKPICDSVAPNESMNKDNILSFIRCGIDMINKTSKNKASSRLRNKESIFLILTGLGVDFDSGNVKP